MKKIIFSILLFFVQTTLLFPFQNNVDQKHKIKIGAFNYYPGIFKDNEDGLVKGFIVDVLNEIAANENWELEYVYGSWDEGLNRIKNGEVDLLTSVAYTEERAKFMDYPETPILTVWGELYAHDHSSINGLIDLTGKKIALMKSDFNGESFLHLINSFHIKCDIIYMDNFELIFKAISDENIDCGVVNNLYGAAKQKEYSLKSTGVIFNPFEINFTTAKNKNGDVLSTINSYISKWKKDENSSYHKALHSWTYKDANFISTVPDWFTKLLIFIILFILLTWIFIYFLRKKVREAKHEIADNEKRYQLAMQLVNDGVMDWNLITNEIYFSPSWKSMLGYKDNEIKNEISEWEKLTRPEDVKRTNVILNELFEGKREKFVSEIKMLHKNGEWKDILARANIILNEKGKPIRLVGTHVDITERKNAERAVIENQRLSAIGEMSSAVAHDFNNSLQSICSNAELALISINNSEKTFKYLEIIKRAAGDSSERVKMLQRMTGRKNLSKQTDIIELKEIINDVIIESTPLWKNNPEKEGKKIVINTNYMCNCLITGNRGELKSVIYNMIKNSVEAMPAGGQISIETFEENKLANISFTDTGIGMDEATKMRVFQPFFTSKGFEGGRGLGMSGAYGIIKEHKGKIFVKNSQPGVGTTFIISIPISESEKTNAKESNEILNGKLNILWIDDDEMIANAAKEMLEVLGHNGHVVNSGVEALRKAEINNFDLIITDIGMPDMNGWDFILKFRERYGNDAKIAVLTGWGDQISHSKKHEYKVDYILSKPLTVNDFNNLTSDVIASITK